MHAVLCFTRFSFNVEDNHDEFQSSQLSLISSELYSYSLTDHSLTPLIFAQSHSNLINSTTEHECGNYTSPRSLAKYINE